MTDDATERPDAVSRNLALRVKIAREICPYLTSKQAAYHLGINPKTFKSLRLQGKGPVGRLHGGGWRYHVDDLDAWSASRKGGQGS